MSRISVIAASVVLALVVSTAPASASDFDRVELTKPGVGSVVGGGAETQGIWTWVCQVVLNQCK